VRFEATDLGFKRKRRSRCLRVRRQPRPRRGLSFVQCKARAPSFPAIGRTCGRVGSSWPITINAGRAHKGTPGLLEGRCATEYAHLLRLRTQAPRDR
jgi:hypothetical protein